MQGGEAVSNPETSGATEYLCPGVAGDTFH